MQIFPERFVGEEMTPHTELENSSVIQVVVPTKFRDIVLSHDQAGHLGVRKTYDHILWYIFWPRLKRDVSAYVRTCHTCQLVGETESEH